MSPHAPFVQTQPRLSRFTLKGFLALPRRLCSPPAAVGKVRSFGLTPIFDVQLDDVLDRKHLPPLSLKDFEEWLLYVEQCPENLYFVLWLREYTAKYDRWIAKLRAREAKARRTHTQQSTYRVAWSATTPTSPALELFFSRARETFLVPGAPFELALPPALLDALAVSGHPDPAVLAPARAHIEAALRLSLSRCVRAAYSNVGAYRAACGITGGVFFSLVSTVPPLAVNFVRAHGRWERLAIAPGLWLGLTILIASLRGICMMIYVFGDFRQLRKCVFFFTWIFSKHNEYFFDRFELVRPPPPDSPRDSEAYETEDCTPAIIPPTRPVRALTAPPKIAIRIPTRTPPLSYGPSAATSTSLSTSTSAGQLRTYTHTESSVSYTNTHTSTNTTAHAHTISISSRKSRVGGSSLVHGHGHAYRQSWARDDDARSVPVCESEDELFGDEDESESDAGIFISPAMAPPESCAEDDPAVVNAALALIASGATATTSSGGTSSLFSNPSPFLAPTADCMSMPALGPSIAPHIPAPLPSPAPTPSRTPSAQLPTASFIPAYSESAHKHHKQRSRSLDNESAGDLEAGPSPPSPARPFDFDALPPPPATGARQGQGERGYSMDEKGAGQGQGHDLGLASALGLGVSTSDFDATSPALSDAAARLCEKESGPGAVTARAWNSQYSYSYAYSYPHARGPPSRLAPLLRLPHALFASLRAALSLPRQNCEADMRSWRGRHALEGRVPAFGPVTRVLAPVVARAQWEIVVRAAILAALLDVVVVGAVLALPVPRSRL